MKPNQIIAQQQQKWLQIRKQINIHTLSTKLKEGMFIRRNKQIIARLVMVCWIALVEVEVNEKTCFKNKQKQING